MGNEKWATPTLPAQTYGDDMFVASEKVQRSHQRTKLMVATNN